MDSEATPRFDFRRRWNAKQVPESLSQHSEERTSRSEQTLPIKFGAGSKPGTFPVSAPGRTVFPPDFCFTLCLRPSLYESKTNVEDLEGFGWCVCRAVQ